MGSKRYLRPHPESSLESGKGSGTRRSSLPSVLAERVPRHLGIAALVYAGMFAANTVYPTILVLGGEPADLRHFLSYACIAVGVAVWYLCRGQRVGPHALSWLGVALQVFGSFGIALVSISPLFPGPMEYLGIPWTAVWILGYPMMVPTTPGRAVTGGLLASAACAVAILVNLAWPPGEYLGPGPTAVQWFYVTLANVLCAAGGTVVATAMGRMGNQVARARQLGSYELQELLGRGGMGEVWRARHRMLARPAAVKLILPDTLGEHAVGDLAMRRFRREADATARLESPHSIKLYDFGTTDDGTLYYVMELLQGIDLESLVKRHGPVKPARVIHWLRQACASLSEAHGLGLIHRDVKPANLYACYYALRHDHLKVLDFGLVKSIDTDDPMLTKRTADHAVTGTPAYMPPESLTAESVDGRADLYGLGCVAYFLLTGEMVFDAPSSMKMIVMHLQQKPAPPSERTELEIPKDLEQVVLHCLAKSPDDRPADADALDAELAACADAGMWTEANAREWWERHLPAAAGETGRSTAPS